MQKIMKNKMRRSDKNIAVDFGRGLAVSIAAELLLLAVAAVLTSGGIAAESMMSALTAVCAGVSSFAGAFVCAQAATKLTLPMALSVGTAQLVLNAAFGVMLSGGTGFTLIIPMAFAAGAVAAGVLSALKKGRK